MPPFLSLLVAACAVSGSGHSVQPWEGQGRPSRGVLAEWYHKITGPKAVPCKEDKEDKEDKPFQDKRVDVLEDQVADLKKELDTHKKRLGKAEADQQIRELESQLIKEQRDKAEREVKEKLDKQDRKAEAFQQERELELQEIKESLNESKLITEGAHQKVEKQLREIKAKEAKVNTLNHKLMKEEQEIDSELKALDEAIVEKESKGNWWVSTEREKKALEKLKVNKKMHRFSAEIQLAVKKKLAYSFDDRKDQYAMKKTTEKLLKAVDAKIDEIRVHVKEEYTKAVTTEEVPEDAKGKSEWIKEAVLDQLDSIEKIVDDNVREFNLEFLWAPSIAYRAERKGERHHVIGWFSNKEKEMAKLLVPACANLDAWVMQHFQGERRKWLRSYIMWTQSWQMKELGGDMGLGLDEVEEWMYVHDDVRSPTSVVFRLVHECHSAELARVHRNATAP